MVKYNKFGSEIYIPTCENERILNKKIDNDQLKLLEKNIEDYITNHRLTNGVFAFLNVIYNEIAYLKSQRMFNINEEVNND